MRTVRRIYQLILLSMVVLAVIAGQFGVYDLIGLLVFGILTWFFVGAFVSRLIATMLVNSIRCKGCGLEIPAVGQWKVGAYQDHRERHIFSAKNPMDGTRVGHLNCPQCSCTILV